DRQNRSELPCRNHCGRLHGPHRRGDREAGRLRAVPRVRALGRDDL
ncbi:MAG: hypothetical protein AVDCRST_MAG77-5682, partial [uncultured Chloroflexi bacterium]